MFNRFAESSTQAAGVDLAFFWVALVCTFFGGVVLVAIVTMCIRYRKGSSADRTMGPGSSLPWELSWTILPLILGVALFLNGATTYREMKAPPPNCLQIQVIGKQWMWKIQHPEGAREINELHVPVNQPVQLTLSSEDVIHDFYVPAFRMKMDVVPGRVSSEWFQATETGRFHFFCSQYCGFDHANMVGVVVVMSPSDYSDWLLHGASHVSKEPPHELP